MPNIAAVIVAGGKGSRMGTDVPKQYLELKGKPILAETVSIFEENALIDQIVLVVPKGEVEKNRVEIVEKYEFHKVKHIVEAGHERQNSVFNGLKLLQNGADFVVVHDGVRPLLSQTSLEKVIKEALATGAAVLGVPVKDSIKEVGEKCCIEKALPREKLWAMQTPQVFSWEIIWVAFQKAMVCGFSATDDAGIIEWHGKEIKVVEGEAENIKITTPVDLCLAKAILETKACE